MSDILQQKAALRSELKSRLKEMTAEQAEAGSLRICERILAEAGWREAGSVLLYAPMKFEVNVERVIAAGLTGGKTICLPRYSGARKGYEAAVITDCSLDLATGGFGVREPRAGCPVRPLNQLDLMIVPGLGFSASGLRLGRGKGFYDRILSEARGARWGVAFECQIVPRVPAEPHDVVLQSILTPSRRLRAA